MKEWIQLIILPIFGFIFGYYHRFVISPRFKSAEKRLEFIEKYHDQQIKDTAEMKTDVKWIKRYLEKNGNN